MVTADDLPKDAFFGTMSPSELRKVVALQHQTCGADEAFPTCFRRGCLSRNYVRKLSMKLKMILAPMALLGAMLAAPLHAQQLPGSVNLGSSGPAVLNTDGFDYLKYYSAFPVPGATLTAALVSTWINSPFTLPHCNWTDTYRVYVNAKAVLRVEISALNSRRQRVVVWKQCTASTQTWPATGQNLIYTGYHPNIGSFGSSARLDMNLFVPIFSWVTEWKAFAY